jgi:hypothetical protein
MTRLVLLVTDRSQDEDRVPQLLDGGVLRLAFATKPAPELAELRCTAMGILLGAAGDEVSSCCRTTWASSEAGPLRRPHRASCPRR